MLEEFGVSSESKGTPPRRRILKGAPEEVGGRVQVGNDGVQMRLEARGSGRMREVPKTETLHSRGHLTNAHRNIYSMSVYIRFKNSRDSITI